MRNPSITILKAIAIILVVMAHSCAPAVISNFCYMLCVSLFFVASGYCFKPNYLNDEVNFVSRRFRRLYVPFVLWSVIILCLNPVFFSTGILNEQYGNMSGGVTHPLNLHQGLQALWSIVFNMSGYDQFLCGAYWFFRTMLVASIAFLVGMKLVEISKFVRNRHIISTLVVAIIALGLAFWQHSDGLRVTGLAQGGYREFMGIFFIAIGFFYRQFDDKILAVRFIKEKDNEGEEDEEKADDGNKENVGKNTKILAGVDNAYPHWLHSASLVISFCALLAILSVSTPAMSSNATSFGSITMLAISGMVGFCFVYSLAHFLTRIPYVSATLTFIGDNTIYVLGWHLLAFKVVSMLKVGVYGLPWITIGGHPVVHSPEGSWFWILYTIVGLALPLGIVWCTKYCAAHYNIHSYARLAVTMGKGTWNFLKLCGHWISVAAAWLATNGIKGIKIGLIAAWHGICSFCVRFVDTVKAGADVTHDVERHDEEEDEEDEEEDDDEDDDDDDDDDDDEKNNE